MERHSHNQEDNFIISCPGSWVAKEDLRWLLSANQTSRDLFVRFWAKFEQRNRSAQEIREREALKEKDHRVRYIEKVLRQGKTQKVINGWQ